MKGTRLLIAAAVLLLLGGLAFYLNRTFTWVKASEWRGYRGQAASNPFLALQRLSERMGHPAACLRGLPDLKRLPTEDTLVLPRRRQAMTEAQGQAVADWVTRGGTLVTEGLEKETEEASTTRDPLLRRLSLRLLPAQPADVDGTLSCQIEGADLRLRTGRGLRLKFSGKGEGGVFSAEGLQAIKIEKGKGGAYAFTRLGFLANPALPDLDHADAFCAMALRDPEEGEPPHRVWIVAWEEPLGLWTWLGRRAPALLASAAVLALLVLAAAAPRFGPLLEAPGLGGRRFLEHLDAAGAWHWRRDDGRHLIQACRAAFHRRLARIHPGWANLSPDLLCQRLAQHAGLPEDQVFRALRFDTAEDPEGFLEAVRTLEILRRQL